MEHSTHSNITENIPSVCIAISTPQSAAEERTFPFKKSLIVCVVFDNCVLNASEH